jgi:hypothetical protein
LWENTVVDKPVVEKQWAMKTRNSLCSSELDGNGLRVQSGTIKSLASVTPNCAVRSTSYAAEIHNFVNLKN